MFDYIYIISQRFQGNVHMGNPQPPTPTPNPHAHHALPFYRPMCSQFYWILGQIYDWHCLQHQRLPREISFGSKAYTITLSHKMVSSDGLSLKIVLQEDLEIYKHQKIRV